MSQRYKAAAAQGVDTERRRFMLELGSALLLLPASGVIAACTGSASTTLSNDLTFTSSVVDSHTHKVQISMADLTSAQGMGESLVTSSTVRHVHVVELTQAEMNAIDAGQTVTKTTSRARSHAHVFTFAKNASVEAPPSPSRAY